MALITGTKESTGSVDTDEVSEIGAVLIIVDTTVGLYAHFEGDSLFDWEPVECLKNW